MSALEATTSTWNALVCPGKDNADDVELWVNRIAVCLKHTLSSKDLIASSTTVLKDMGVLTNGVIMTASGNEMDCLIHSFLTCISSSFRKCNDNTRDTIASYFRRIILVKKLNDSITAFNNASNTDKISIEDSFIIKNNRLEFPALLQKNINELKSGNMLSTSIAALLATYYNVYIIVIGSQNQFETYIKSVIGKQIDKLIVFYNYSNVHFTPIIFNNNRYVDNSNQYQLRNVPIQIIEALQTKIQSNLQSTLGVVSKNEGEVHKLLSSIEKIYKDPLQINEAIKLYNKVYKLIPNLRTTLSRSALNHIINHIKQVKNIIDDTRKKAPTVPAVPKIQNVPAVPTVPTVPALNKSDHFKTQNGRQIRSLINNKSSSYITYTKRVPKGGRSTKRYTKKRTTRKTKKNKK